MAHIEGLVVEMMVLIPKATFVRQPNKPKSTN